MRQKYFFVSLGLFLIVALGWAWPSRSYGEVTRGPSLVVLVRHAEEAAGRSDDPGLTDAGKIRARDLAASLRDAGVTAIITSSFRRTAETAAPLAAVLGLAPVAVPIGNSVDGHIAAVAAAVRGRTGVVLVVGHSNTVPQIIARLGGPTVPDICASVYDNLFSLITVDGKADLIHARYGVATPGSRCSQK